MVPPAPTTFSMTKGCFSVALIELPSSRAMTSPGPPAENGTTRGDRPARIFLSERRQRRRQQQQQQDFLDQPHCSLPIRQAGFHLGFRKVLIGTSTGYSSAMSCFDAEDCSIMLSAATAAALT